MRCITENTWETLVILAAESPAGALAQTLDKQHRVGDPGAEERMEKRVRFHRLAQRSCVVLRPRLPVSRRGCLLPDPLPRGSDPPDPSHLQADVQGQELQ